MFVMRLGVLLEGVDDVPDELACANAARSFSFSFPRPVTVLKTLTNGLISRLKPELEAFDEPDPALARLDEPDDVEVAGVGRPSDSCAVAGWKLGRGL